MTVLDWHVRFCQQANWTRPLRSYLFEQAGLKTARSVLEAGCGTGAILSELHSPAALHGLDLEPAHLNQARIHAPAVLLACGDAQRLPYPDDIFDITYCHFLLLWVPDPLQVLRELRRVTRPGGHVLALAEPNYNRRVDRPAELTELGRLQTESLRRQGADPSLGGRLAALFDRAGIQIVETGELAQAESDPLTPDERELEWAVIEADLAGQIPPEDIQQYKKLDAKAWERGKRRLYVPTYFAWGRA
jgi:SAM-dependent methyltransferase